MAVDSLYAATGEQSSAAEAVNHAYAVRAQAVRAGASQQQFDALAAVGMSTLAEWIGCDVATLQRALAAALESER